MWADDIHTDGQTCVAIGRIVFSDIPPKKFVFDEELCVSRPKVKTSL